MIQRIERVPINNNNPRLLDKVITELQRGLADRLPWLNHSFGKAERLVKMIDGRKVYTPNIYIGKNEYELLAPDDYLGNFSFFTIDDPQEISWSVGETSEIKSPFSLIVWVDMRKIQDVDNRDTESVKRQILRSLNGEIRLRHGSITINKIYERAENIFRGFTLDEIDNQFLMSPFMGWRFEGLMKVDDDCI